MDHSEAYEVSRSWRNGGIIGGGVARTGKVTSAKLEEVEELKASMTLTIQGA